MAVFFVCKKKLSELKYGKERKTRISFDGSAV